MTQYLDTETGSKISFEDLDQLHQDSAVCTSAANTPAKPEVTSVAVLEEITALTAGVGSDFVEFEKRILAYVTEATGLDAEYPWAIERRDAYRARYPQLAAYRSTQFFGETPIWERWQTRLPKMASKRGPRTKRKRLRRLQRLARRVTRRNRKGKRHGKNRVHGNTARHQGGP